MRFDTGNSKRSAEDNVDGEDNNVPRRRRQAPFTSTPESEGAMEDRDVNSTLLNTAQQASASETGHQYRPASLITISSRNVGMGGEGTVLGSAAYAATWNVSAPVRSINTKEHETNLNAKAAGFDNVPDDFDQTVAYIRHMKKEDELTAAGSIPNKGIAGERLFRCPICGKLQTRRHSVLSHFQGCVKQYGNPGQVKWDDHPTCKRGERTAHVGRRTSAWNRRGTAGGQYARSAGPSVPVQPSDPPQGPQQSARSPVPVDDEQNGPSVPDATPALDEQQALHDYDVYLPDPAIVDETEALRPAIMPFYAQAAWASYYDVGAIDPDIAPLEFDQLLPRPPHGDFDGLLIDFHNFVVFNWDVGLDLVTNTDSAMASYFVRYMDQQNAMRRERGLQPLESGFGPFVIAGRGVSYARRYDYEALFEAMWRRWPVDSAWYGPDGEPVDEA